MKRWLFELKRGNWRVTLAWALLLCVAGGYTWSRLVVTNAPLAPQTPTESLVAACPGVARYTTDILLSPPTRKRAIEDFHNVRAGDEIHMIEAIVSDTPSRRVAADFKAAGQHCFFDISLDLTTVAVVKRACVSLCADSTEAWTKPSPLLAYFRIGSSPVYSR